jgi:FkbM family methyltransferase
MLTFLTRPEVRSFFRRTGLAHSGGRVLRLLSGGSMTYGDRYEARLATELLNSVSRGDCVWDVGANVGHFTRQLAERVGESGCVIAFEPFQSTFNRLCAETSAFPQVRCLRLALGAEDRDLVVDGVPESPSNTLAGHEPSGHGEPIHVTTGTKLIQGGHPGPTVLKIDVEGHEEDVLWGIRESLKGSGCHTVFVEVHYTQLEGRGFLRAPDRIISTLRDLGFRTAWLDSNHLKGVRPTSSR